MIPLLVDALETTTWRSAAGSSPTARTCARASPGTGGSSARRSTCSRRSGSSARSRTPSAASRASRRAAAQDLFARQKISSIVFDVELIYLARKRGYWLAIVPIRWADRRGSRMRARPGLALRVAWDLFRIPLIHRGLGRAVVAPRAGRSPARIRPTASQPDRDSRRHRRAWPERPCRSSRSSSSASSSARPCGRPRARARSASTSWPTTRRRTGCSRASRCTTRRPADRRVRPLLLPAAVRPRDPAVRPARSDDRDLAVGRRCRSRRSSSGVALMPVAPTVRWLTLLLAGLSWPFAYAFKLGQVGPLLFLLFAIGWRWLDRRRRSAGRRRPGRSSRSSPGSSSAGRS